MLSFFPRDVLDEILNLIESVSEGFPSYSCINTSVENSLERRQPDFDTSKWRGDGTPARVTSPQPMTNERFFSTHLFC